MCHFYKQTQQDSGPAWKWRLKMEDTVVKAGEGANTKKEERQAERENLVGIWTFDLEVVKIMRVTTAKGMLVAI